MSFDQILRLCVAVFCLATIPKSYVYAQDDEAAFEDFDAEESGVDQEMQEAEPAETPEPVETAEPVETPEPMETPEPVEATAQLAPSDDPDLNYEAKLHDIFLNFYNAKMPDAEWDTLVGSRRSEVYNIQGGDNLWDISKTLFGDGNYWPKVWSLNSSIKNPHLISPNNSIRFLLGDESEPPAFTVTENATENSTAAPSASSAAPQGEALNTESVSTEEPEPEIPPPLKVSRPVVKRLPPSLPEWQDIAGQGNYDELGISYSRRKIADIEDTIPLASYISEDVPEHFGVIKEIEVGHKIATAYQYIYVAMKKGVGNVGDKYLAVANRGKIESVNKHITGFLGYTMDIQGEVQLVERVEATNELKDGEMYRALVLNIVNPVGVDSILISGKIENIQITDQGPRSQVVAQIIGGSYFTRRQVYANESIVYINRGESDGLQVGQILPVRANRKIRNEDTEVLSNIRPIGWLRVVKTTPKFATTVVVKAWSDIASGDLTGSGEMLPNMSSEEPAASKVSDSSDVQSDEMDSPDINVESDVELDAESDVESDMESLDEEGDL